MSGETKTHYGIFITKTLSALVITGALAAIDTAPAAAQTATKLDCKDCIKSKQIEDGKIKGKDLKDGAVGNDKLEDGAVDSAKIEDSSVGNIDLSGDAVTSDKIADSTVDTPDLASNAVTTGKIATGAVNSSKVQNNSLTSQDMANEAGANFASGDQDEELTGTETVRSVTISAPSSGVVIVHANGYFNFQSTNRETVICSITTGTVIDDTHRIAAGDFGIITHQATVPFGLNRGFNISAAGSETYNLVCREDFGDVSVVDSSLTAVFYPTVY